ncbi:thioredoxin family protein [Nocardiopsis sediminis]|uniref:Thioredoxin n=1 Tax=Nocardiopsis sediminis TaxID=1778267 RepID=A0ABV8FP64_9ACTN
MITTAGVGEVTDATFTDEVLAAGGPVLVMFTADWCPSCRQLAPVLGAVAGELGDRLTIVQIDADTNPRTPVDYGVLALPTLALFRGGRTVKTLVGARSRRKLLQELADVI